MQQDSTRVYGFDLADALASGETVLSVTSSLTLSDGTDSVLSLNPTGRFNGSPFINGTEIAQSISLIGGTASLNGNSYVLAITANTSLGQTILIWTRLRVEFGFGVPLTTQLAPSSSVQVYVLPAPAPKFTLPAAGGYCGEDFPVVDLGETRLFGFDFSPSASPNEAVTSASLSLNLLSGIDPMIADNPFAYNSGSPILNGTTVQQMIAIPTVLPDLSANRYALGAYGFTNFAQVLAAWSRIPIGVIG